jgi:mono/diheme cytochrome c family protein
MSDASSNIRQGTDYSESSDVQQVHAAIAREKREPRVGLEPLSMWLIVVYGLALFFGGAYLGRFSGDFSGDSLNPNPGPSHPKGPGGGGEQAAAVLTPAERGKKLFSAYCATCHQMTGLGVAGQYPPLAGSEFVNGGTRRLGMIVLKGLIGPIKVKGTQFGTAQMQAWETNFTDQKVADILTFIRQEWGNTGGPVAAESISALRKELASRKESWTEPDLLAVPADANLPGGDATAAKPGEQPAPSPTPQPKA